jgi:hypothetical protein
VKSKIHEAFLCVNYHFLKEHLVLKNDRYWDISPCINMKIISVLVLFVASAIAAPAGNYYGPIQISIGEHGKSAPNGMLVKYCLDGYCSKIKKRALLPDEWNVIDKSRKIEISYTYGGKIIPTHMIYKAPGWYGPMKKADRTSTWFDWVTWFDKFVARKAEEWKSPIPKNERTHTDLACMRQIAEDKIDDLNLEDAKRCLGKAFSPTQRAWKIRVNGEEQHTFQQYIERYDGIFRSTIMTS